MKNPILYLIVVFFFGCQQKVTVETSLEPLKISENRRYLMTENRNPFFWLGDTGWLLFTKLNREE